MIKQIELNEPELLCFVYILYISTIFCNYCTN